MSGPSPACTVRDGTGAPQVTPPFATATPGATITIALASTAGVNTWALACTSADETTDPASIALTVNATSKTATFVAPGAGKALLFTSIVEGGYDRNGVAQPSYSTTFKIATATPGGLYVAAAGEIFEHDPVYGTAGVINTGIRNAALAGASGRDAFTTTTASFTIPASLATATIAVVSTAWMAAGQYVFLATAGTFLVTSITDATHAVLQNLGYAENAAPTTVIASASALTPGGAKGVTGAAGGGGFASANDQDLSALANLNLLPGGDGTRTIGGVTWHVYGTANLASLAVVNGTGVVGVTNSGISGGQGFGLWMDTSSLAAQYADYNGADEWDVAAHWSFPALTANAEECGLDFGYNPSAGFQTRARIARIFLSSLEWENCYSVTESSGLSATRGETDNLTDDVFRLYMKSGWMLDTYSGLYTTDFPRAMSYRGSQTLVNTSTSPWVPRGKYPAMGVFYASGSGATPSRTCTLSRFRIRTKLI